MRIGRCLFYQRRKAATLLDSNATSTQASARNYANGKSPATADGFISIIHSTKTSLQLKEIHGKAFRLELTQDSFVVTQFVAACSRFKLVDYAVSIFGYFSSPNPFVFNALIRALCDAARFDLSVSHFVLMLRFDVRPNRLTFPFVVKSAAGLMDFGLGGALHAGVTKMGFELDSFVRISLLDMYVKLSLFGNALQLFYETPERNKAETILLWNVVISGCCRAGNFETAVELFQQMPERNAASWNSLIDGFMKKGDLNRAKALFNQMPEKNVVSWTTMVAGYSHNGDNEQALDAFDQMLKEGERPNYHTLVSVLSACARIGALDAGTRIHDLVLHGGFNINGPLGTAMVDMYTKCGKIEKAKQVFDRMKEKDLLTWSVMILGWAIHGCLEEAIQCFEGMKLAGITPDDVVFLAILTSCVHSGSVDRGLYFFSSMKQDYLIEPNIKHYACIVDLLGKAGRLEEALNFIRNMPIKPDVVMWGALFCACNAHRNIEMAKLASEELLALDHRHRGSYIFLSNIYARTGRWNDAENVRVKMRHMYIEKSPGWSFIEVESHVHRFVAGDRSHPCVKDIYSKLEELIMSARVQGYVPDTEWVLHNIEEEEKDDALGYHSEKLALAFGLITIPNREAIRIVKNLRVCGDCHALMKYASKLIRRDIILRDIKRFHHFKDGLCSCKDYW